MTERDALFRYRLAQAEETLLEAERMSGSGFSSRTIINRAYYAMFYSLLALFLKTGIDTKTSKHSGVIAVFDKELVRTGKIEKRYSKMLHDTFDARQEGDYREFAEVTAADADAAVKNARAFLDMVKSWA